MKASGDGFQSVPQFWLVLQLMSKTWWRSGIFKGFCNSYACVFSESAFLCKYSPGYFSVPLPVTVVAEFVVAGKGD